MGRGRARAAAPPSARGSAAPAANSAVQLGLARPGGWLGDHLSPRFGPHIRSGKPRRPAR